MPRLVIPRPTQVFARVTLPPPREVGVEETVGSVAESPDWSATRRRLEALGATAFQVRRLPEGGWRFVCQLATGEPGRHRRIDVGPAATEGEAIARALAEAESGTGGR